MHFGTAWMTSFCLLLNCRRYDRHELNILTIDASSSNFASSTFSSSIALSLTLTQWNEQARPLHARGLRQVLMRLNHLANYRESLETRSKGKSLFLFSCNVDFEIGN